MTDTARKLAVFPAFHKVAGRRVVIVGGGAEAAAKIRLLSETKAQIVVFAASLEQGTGADLIAAHGDWRGAWPVAADLAGAALVFAATELRGDRPRGRRARPFGRRADQRRRSPRPLRLLYAGAGQPRAARHRHWQRRRGAGAHPPCARPHRGPARAGLRRPRGARRQDPRARDGGVFHRRRSPPLLGALLLRSRRREGVRRPHRRKRSRRRCGRSRSTPTGPATFRWLAPAPVPRTC